MVWPSSAQGNRSYAPSTGEAVYNIVTSNPRYIVFYPSYFQFVVNSLFSLWHKSIRELLCNHILPHSAALSSSASVAAHSFQVKWPCSESLTASANA